MRALFYCDGVTDLISESGFINLNKPAGMSSAAAVSRVRRVVGGPCGHMGTLDPLAVGVLPVAVGNASRLFGYLLDKEKVYRAVFRFGIGTDTLDSTGTVLHAGLPVPAQSEIEAALPALTGTLEQIPPAFSAKSVNGVRAYKLARRGEAPVLAAKTVRVRSFALLERVGEDGFAFRIACGGGTYIRSLARDLAAACGTEAIMTELVREQSGSFRLENAVAPEELTAENWREKLVPPDAAFDMPRLDFAGREAQRLGWGQRLTFAGADGAYKLYLDGAFYGIAQACGGVLRAGTKLV